MTSPDRTPSLNGAFEKGLTGSLTDVAFHLRRHKVDQLYTIVLTPDIAKPVTNITAENEGIICGFVLGALVADERDKRHAGHFHLLVRHLVQLRNRDFFGALDPLEVRIVGRRIPVEERGVVDEVL